MRTDLWERPRGEIVVEENQFFHVRMPLPVWRCDQVECVKRSWSETIQQGLGVWPITNYFHLEVLSDGGSAPRPQDLALAVEPQAQGAQAVTEQTEQWVWTPATEYIYPYYQNSVFRVVYDVVPPQFWDVSEDFVAWPAAQVCAQFARRPVPLTDL